MKKLWTIVLAIFGVGGDAFADCYAEAEQLVGMQREVEIDFCVESDMERLRIIKKYYHSVSTERKIELAREASLITDRLGRYYSDDQIILASGVCRVCVEDGEGK